MWGLNLQETHGAGKCYTSKTNISKFINNNTKQTVKADANNSTRYFIAGLNCDSDKRKSAKSTQQIHKDFNYVFNGMGGLNSCFLCSSSQTVSHTRHH